MSERDTRSGKTSESPDNTEQRRARNAKSFFATLVCVLGILLAVGVAIATVFSGARADIVSAGVVGVGLGVLGYVLGAGRLALATIIISVLACLFGLLINEVIPGIGGEDRQLRAVEPSGKD